MAQGVCTCCAIEKFNSKFIAEFSLPEWNTPSILLLEDSVCIQKKTIKIVV